MYIKHKNPDNKGNAGFNKIAVELEMEINHRTEDILCNFRGVYQLGENFNCN